MMLEIAPVSEKYLPELANCFRQAYIPLGEPWDFDNALKFITFKYNRMPDLSFVSLLDGHPIGGIFTDMKPWHDGNHLCEGELFIAPKYHGLFGVALKLCASMLKCAKEKYNCTFIEGVTFKQGNQLALYKKFGYTEDKTLTFITGEIGPMLQKMAPYLNHFQK